MAAGIDAVLIIMGKLRYEVFSFDFRGKRAGRGVCFSSRAKAIARARWSFDECGQDACVEEVSPDGNHVTIFKVIHSGRRVEHSPILRLVPEWIPDPEEPDEGKN